VLAGVPDTNLEKVHVDPFRRIKSRPSPLG
jgi:hypothetical protein